MRCLAYSGLLAALSLLVLPAASSAQDPDSVREQEQVGIIVPQMAPFERGNTSSDGSASSVYGQMLPRLALGYDRVSLDSGLLDDVADSADRFNLGLFLPLWSSVTGGSESCNVSASSSYSLTAESSLFASSMVAPILLVGVQTSYGHSDYNLRNDVAFNQPGGRDLKLDSLKTNMVGFGPEARLLIPLDAGSSGYMLQFHLATLGVFGRTSSSFREVPFSFDDRQLINDVDAEQFNAENIQGGRIRGGIGIRGENWSLSGTVGFERTVTTFATDQRNWNSAMIYGIEGEILLGRESESMNRSRRRGFGPGF